MKKKKHLFYINLFLTALLLVGIFSLNERRETLHEDYELMKETEAEIGIAYNQLSECLTKVEEHLKYLDCIYTLAGQYNIPPELALAMMKVESNFDPNAVSKTGDRGIMQINDIHNVANVLDLRANTEYAFSLLSGLAEDTDMLHAQLGSYNMGRTGYREHAASTKMLATSYSNKVIGLMDKLKGEQK